MGLKRNKYTTDGEASAKFLRAQLQKIDDISSKKMFGGHGFFHHKQMFAMVTSKGEIFFKTNESNIEDYQLLKAMKHSRMPYHSVPEKIISNPQELQEWAIKAIRSSKK